MIDSLLTINDVKDIKSPKKATKNFKTMAAIKRDAETLSYDKRGIKHTKKKKTNTLLFIKNWLR